MVFGLIAVAGARIWVQNRVDLSQNSNLIMVAVTLVLGAGDFALSLGGFTLGGIGTATFGAILLHALLNRRAREAEQPDVTPFKTLRLRAAKNVSPHNLMRCRGSRQAIKPPAEAGGEEDVAGAEESRATSNTVSRAGQL